MNATTGDAPALASLRRAGVGGRVLKTGLAVGIAWYLGGLLPLSSGPYLAPLAALLSMQITIADSLAAATQRVLGIVVGVAVAIAVTAVVGVNAVTVGVLVALSLAAGSLLRLGSQAVQQVAVSALLLVAVGGVSSLGYAVARVVETLVGAAVGVAVNAVLAPPTHLAAARAAVLDHAAAVASSLDRLAAALADGVSPASAAAALAAARASDATLRTAQDAVARTETAHRFNLWNRHERIAVRRLARALRTQERVAIQSRGIVRTIDDAVAAGPRPPWLAPGSFDGALVGAVASAAAMIRAFPAAMLGGPASAAAGTVGEHGRRGATLGAAVARLERGGTPAVPDDWIPLGSVLADLGRVRRELLVALASDDDDPLPPSTAPSDAVAGVGQ